MTTHKRAAIASIFLIASAAFGPGAAPPKRIKVVLVGDSTVNDEGGWGPGFRASFGPQIDVVNLAKNGRSSKSFRDEGLWKPAIDAKPDYILIQFGHNDVPGKGPERQTDPRTTYRANMIRYLDEARAVGAKPVLITSIVRRNFNPDGTIKVDSLMPYVTEVRAIASEKNIPLIDLYTLTVQQAEKTGPTGAIEIGRTGPDGKLDTTHLGPKGQQEIGRMAAIEFARAEPAVRPFLISSVAAAPIHFTVAADGSGDAKTVQYAIDHAPTQSEGQRLIIEIRPGIYHERIYVPRSRGLVTFLGQAGAQTIITYDMSAKAAGGTFVSSTVDVEADGFEAQNMTFENTFGVGSQAVAISVHSDRAVFRNCRFLGWQDTLYAESGRQYYKDCYIEGHVDFIFGNAAAVFDNCQIHSRGPGYITAHSRTTNDQPTGYVFVKCRLTAENTESGVFLGRPWRPYARVVYIDCTMDGHIRPEGWDNWRSAANEQTAWFAEFGSTGVGAHTTDRAGWAHQLDAQQAAQFRPGVFLRGGDGWNPLK